MDPDNRYILVKLLLYSKGYISYYYKRFVYKYYKLKEDFYIYCKKYLLDIEGDYISLESSIEEGYSNNECISISSDDSTNEKYDDFINYDDLDTY